LGGGQGQPDFAAQFKGKPLNKPMKVTTDGGEINALSGATITSRAVVRPPIRPFEIQGNQAATDRENEKLVK
jgi:Na+-translocating ferredoxin:NAD+ oxidoreductase RnfG subunit